MAGVLRPQPGIRARSVRTVPTEPGVGRSRDPGAVRDLDASKRGIARACGGVAAPEDRRRREPRGVHPALRASRGPARSARRHALPAIRRCSPETHGVTDEDLRALPASARLRRRWPIRGTTAYDAIEALRRRLLLDDRATTTRTCSCPTERDWLRQAAEGGPLPRAGRSDQPGRAARPADAGRGVRAVPAPHLPRQDALLDRRARHARADPRRGDRRSRPRPASGTS